MSFHRAEKPYGTTTAATESEDAYAIVRGTGAVIVDGQEAPVRPGQFIAVTPDSARHLRASDGGLVFIAVCTTPA